MRAGKQSNNAPASAPIMPNNFGKSTITLNDLIVVGRNSPMYARKCQNVCNKHYQIHWSEDQKKGSFIMFWICFLWSKLIHESSLFKQAFPKKFFISSSTQIGKHPNFGLNAERVPIAADRKSCFLFLWLFWLHYHS